MKKLLAAILVAAAVLGLSGCMVISCEEPWPPRHVHAVYVPPRPPREVIVVPGPRPPHRPPVYRHHID